MLRETLRRLGLQIAFEGDGFLVVKNGTGYYRIDEDQFDGDEEDLKRIILNHEDPAPLTIMTRIVGYYSRTKDWNRSKVQELEDRRKGSYALKEGK